MAVLINTGMPGQLEQIRLAMSEVGVPFDNLKALCYAVRTYSVIYTLISYSFP
jgi:hypothetical protein